jgi:hypothetical protein
VVDLRFDHTERETGGTKRPTEITLRGLHPETGDEVGTVKYLMPRRKADKIYIQGLEVHPEHQGNGFGHQLMDELQTRHPATPIDHGDRTVAGQGWWKSYTRDKRVQKGRTVARRKTADEHSWDFQHFSLGKSNGNEHYRLLATAPKDRGGKTHMLEYALTPKKTIKYKERDLERLPDDHSRGALKSGVHEEHKGYEDHDPNYHDPRPPQPVTPEHHEYYHGTTVPNVSHILPANQHGGPQVFGNGISSRDHAYATTSESDAWEYAKKAWHAAPSGRPRVYRVHPIGGREDVEPDPEVDEFGHSRGVNQSDHRSTQGFHVLHEMPMPRDYGDPEDWDR